MIRRFLLLGTIIILLILQTSSCKHKLYSEFDEGYIEYLISYDQSIPSKYDPDLLPDKMVVKFLDNNILNKIEGLHGVITLTFITNAETQKSITLVKLLNKKIFFEEPIIKGKYPKVFSEMPQISITKSDESFKFQGYECKKASAVFLDSSNYSFEIIYTDKIRIEKPNANTPFESIDGIMLKFNVKLYNQILTLTSSNIKSSDIPREEFSIPAEYERVNEETIDEVISLLQ